MPTLLKTLALTAAILTTATVLHAEEKDPMSNDQKNVRAAVEQMTQAFQNNDIDGVMASYAEKATVMFEPGTTVSDLDVVKAMFKDFTKIDPRFEYSGHEVLVAEDIAVHLAPWTMKATSPDGAAIEESGLSVAVLRKQANGRWLIVIDNPHGDHLLKN